MLRILRYYRPLLRHCFAIVCLMLLASCTHAPSSGASQPVTVGKSATSRQEDAAYALVKQAEKAASPAREQLLLQAADVFQAAGDRDRTGRVLVEIDPRMLSGAPLVHYSLMYGAWALTKHQLNLAEKILLEPRLNATTVGMDNSSVAQLHGLRAELYEAEQRALDAVFERLAQSPLMMDEAGQREVSEATWRLLSQLRDDEFLWLETQPQEQLLGGWVALARIQRQGFGNVEKQAADLRSWQQSWAVHPANRFMPADMKLLRHLLDEQPKHIALLLPFTGKLAQAGRAVRDGFLAVYYRSLAAGAPAVQVDMVDSNATPDILSAYNAAVAHGAELVIGPLEREQVQALSQQGSLAVPTLALNNPPNASATPTQLYQFSLNPEDEIKQLAEAAWANRMHRALIITPDNDKGERLRQSFVQTWQALGAEVAAQVRYQPDNGNYSMQVAEGLGLDLATGHYREGNVPPDMVLLLGKASDVSAVLTSLARNGGGQLPVYSSSQIFEASGSARASGKTEGVRLCLTPWQVGQGPLREAGVAAPAASELLYVLGADAQQLYLRLPLMQANASLHVPGNTGYLHLDDQRRVVRKLVWSVMQDGHPQPLPVDTAGDQH